MAAGFLEEFERKQYKAKARLLKKLLEVGEISFSEAAKELKTTSEVVKGLEKVELFPPDSRLYTEIRLLIRMI